MSELVLGFPESARGGRAGGRHDLGAPIKWTIFGGPMNQTIEERVCFKHRESAGNQKVVIDAGPHTRESQEVELTRVCRHGKIWWCITANVMHQK